jgi:formaldehyde-activating enzyme involved in methanogenesis
MGEARRRGTFQERKAAAIAAGRVRQSSGTAESAVARSLVSPSPGGLALLALLAPWLATGRRPPQ